MFEWFTKCPRYISIPVASIGGSIAAASLRNYGFSIIIPAALLHMTLSIYCYPKLLVLPFLNGILGILKVIFVNAVVLSMLYAVMIELSNTVLTWSLFKPFLSASFIMYGFSYAYALFANRLKWMQFE